MTESQQPLEFTAGLSFTQKIGMVAGSVSALYLLPSAANAAIVHKTTLLTITNTSLDGLGNGVDWDVDGNGTNEFILWNYLNVSFTPPGNFLNLANNASNLFVRGIPDDSLAIRNLNLPNLPMGFTVGPTLGSNYTFGGASITARTIINNDGIIGGNIVGFTQGIDGYLGFKFKIGSNTHYGWALLSIPATNTSSAYSYTIQEWAYNNEAGAPIQVGDTGPTVPEPTSSLALLAFGAAGVYRWRKGKSNPAQDEDSNEDLAS